MSRESQRKAYWAVKNRLTPIENELIKFYELQWLLSMRVPTVQEVADYIKQSLTATNYYLQRPPVIKALDTRGIPWRQHTQSELTSTQVAAASLMMNPADNRPASVKLDELGVLPSTYQAWLNDPQFQGLVETLSQRALGNIKPTAIAEYTKLVQAGDKQVILHYMDNTGIMKQTEGPQSEVLIMMLIEIIQRHVQDADTIVKIANDIKLATANRTLEAVSHEVLEQGPITHVQDLVSVEEARKALGV